MSEAKIEHRVKGQPTREGAGVNLTRVIGTAQLRNLDPFLMLDEFKSDDPGDYIAGFPEHPHRGFETVTYMLAGNMEHRDHMGNVGNLAPGSVQWMTAGKGVIHSEMPQQIDGMLWGFQLWINLPAKRKMVDAAYQEYTAAEIPVAIDEQGVQRKVIAGESLGVEGLIQAPDTQPLYIDVSMPNQSELVHPLSEGHRVMIYVYQGKIAAGDEPLAASELAILTSGDQIRINAAEDSKFLLIGGKPIGEPIVQHGPFVMNTQEEIFQAIHDYQAGQLTA